MFGAAGKGISKDDLNVIRELGIVSQLRGLDGAGIYETNSDAAGKAAHEILAKSDQDFNDLMYCWTNNKKSKDNVLYSIYADVFLGHVRAATVGPIDAENTQPFKFNSVIGTHNGTLKDKQYLGHRTRSDSNLMFEEVSQRGIESVLKELHTDSAYAIVMYDKTSKQLAFVRNSKRFLYVAFNYKRRVMYWCSEKGLLKAVLDRNGIDYEGYDMKTQKSYGGILLLNEGVVWVIKPSEIGSKLLDKGPVIYEKDKPVVKTPVIVSDERQKSSISFKSECAFCKKELSLYEQYKIKFKNEGIYDEQNGVYFCPTCCETDSKQAS